MTLHWDILLQNEPASWITDIRIMDLQKVRDQIDTVDQEIIKLLNQRVALAGEIGKIKLKQGADMYVPSREEQVFQKVLHYNDGNLPESSIKGIYREIISASISLEKKLIIAYLGPKATYTHQAAIKNFGSSLDYKALNTIQDVFSDVESGASDYGVIPIENSSEGAVYHTLDMLVESDLKIVAQVYLPIEHCLISEGTLATIKQVHSKDQALGQCREWLHKNFEKVDLVEASSTGKAVQIAKGNPELAAIAGSLAAESFDVPIVQKSIQDRSDNFTRFLIVGERSSSPIGNGKDKTSIVLSISDQVGALGAALSPFSSRNINLCKIESRPSRKKAWDYFFFIDFIGHYEEPIIQEAIQELEQSNPMVKWLGSYPNSSLEIEQ
jgi:chorismate mutase/prephenate dehydratase